MAAGITRGTRIVLAFAIVYLVWGSTYLAIRVMVEHLPPALSAAVRFLVGGALLLTYALWRGHRLPTAVADWRNIALIGIAMLACGNGFVNWSEQWVDSGQAALVVATSALWMAWMGTLGASGESLGRQTVVGLLLGFAGVAVLVGDGIALGTAPPLAYAALLAAPVLWAIGSVWSKRRPVGCTPLMSAAIQTLTAGLVLGVIGLANGYVARWIWEPRSAAALGYLIVFGTCLAYTTYLWLVHEVSPAQLSTYAYINPAVAVLLGWWLLDEHFSRMQILGTVIILCGVVLVTLAQRRPTARAA